MTRKEKNIQSLSTSLSSTTRRKFILILLINADRRDLDPQDLLSRVRSAWECRTVWIAKEESESGGFHYRIGLHTINASKHTFLSIARKIFSEFPEEECQVQSVKGAGPWSRPFSNEKTKTLLLFGEETFSQILEYSQASRKKRKAQRLSDEPEKAKRKRGRPKKTDTSPPMAIEKNRITFFF